MGDFKRGVSSKFIAALRKLSETEGWWRDVLLDDSLIIAVRHEYLNVYWLGQSIFRVAMRHGAITASTHPKYLLDPDLSRQVSFDGHQFALGSLETRALIRTYEPRKTLDKLKRAAGIFAGDEKRGVHAIATSNDSVVDVEIAMPAGVVLNVGSVPRADIAAFEEDEQGIRFVLWEVKTFYNTELRVTGEKNVVDQIKKYKSIVAALRPSIIKSYTCVARNLVDIADMSGGRRKIGDLIRRVAHGDALMVHEPADVGLIVYGFDAAQRDCVWYPLRDSLVEVIGPNRVKARGDANGLEI